MAALAAMACGVPVIASRVDGLPEPIEDGRTEFLCGVADLDGMAECGIALLSDPALHADCRSADRVGGNRWIRPRKNEVMHNLNRVISPQNYLVYRVATRCLLCTRPISPG